PRQDPSAVQALLREEPAAAVVVVLDEDAGGSDDLALLRAGAQDVLPCAGLDAASLRRAVLHAVGRCGAARPVGGAPARTALLAGLSRSLAGGSAAVLVLDVDRAALLSLALGAPRAESCLAHVADVLTTAVAGAGPVVRLGPDVVVAVLPRPRPGELEALSAHLQSRLTGLVRLGDRDVSLSVSTGAALGAPGDDAEDLLLLAEEALRAAKAAGGGRGEVAGPALREGVRRRQSAEDELVAALAEDRVEVHYQPVVRLTDGRPVGAEALVRLRRQDGQLLPPAAFLDVAEETGLVVDLGRAVLRAACREAAGWPDAGLRVAVNVSGRQLAAPGLVADVEQALADSGLPPERLLLEVTEAVVEDPAPARAALAAISALGVATAVDDFGTGWSSLLSLRALPVDVLKVDRTFVGGMLEQPDDAAIVASVVRLGRDLGATVVAEGVETEEQRRRLVQLGCTLGQGRLFAPAVPAADLPAALAATARPRLLPGASDRAVPDRLPAAVRDRMADLRRQGASEHTIAAVLNTEGRLHPSGRRWHARTVARCLEGQPA
ncbi:MAG TPA: GGDEF domain-containing phosphodiesterase, partial [Mycobacteriales bacterium]|nr:GGDEF domain-containing phosphodiesterase [Mycobacteriales bacterium]